MEEEGVGLVPATSKAQYRFIEAVAHGGIKKKGLSKSQAKEYVAGQKYSSLPTKSKKAARGSARSAGRGSNA